MTEDSPGVSGGVKTFHRMSNSAFCKVISFNSDFFAHAGQTLQLCGLVSWIQVEKITLSRVTTYLNSKCSPQNSISDFILLEVLAYKTLSRQISQKYLKNKKEFLNYAIIHQLTQRLSEVCRPSVRVKCFFISISQKASKNFVTR